jgi:malate synthase
VKITAAELVAVPQGTITEAGLRGNMSVGIQYLAAWLGGNGCVPLYNLMEDAATAEISRTQLWQWMRYGAKLDDGRTITPALYDELLPQVMAKIEEEVGAERFAKGHHAEAAELFTKMSKSEDFAEFLTLPAYEMIN